MLFKNQPQKSTKKLDGQQTEREMDRATIRRENRPRGSHMEVIGRGRGGGHMREVGRGERRGHAATLALATGSGRWGRAEVGRLKQPKMGPPIPATFGDIPQLVRFRGKVWPVR